MIHMNFLIQLKINYESVKISLADEISEFKLESTIHNNDKVL